MTPAHPGSGRRWFIPLALAALPLQGVAAGQGGAAPKGSLAVEELVAPETPPPMPTGDEQREISAQIQKYAPAVEECYQARLAAEPGLRGKLIARLDIGPSGRVIGATVDGLDDPGLRQCVLLQVRGWQFKKPLAGGKLRVSYPWEFGPKEEPPAAQLPPLPVAAAAVVTPAQDRAAAAPAAELGPFFQGYDAAFVLQPPDRDKPIVFNRAGAAEREAPLSTFELIQALVALESGAIAGTDVPEAWVGRAFSARDRDQTLRTAIADSASWFFQRVATRVGEKRERAFLKAARYGTAEVGALDSFWLDGSLRISPVEQVDFLNRLVRERELPFSRRTMAQVKPLFQLSSSLGADLSGKISGSPANVGTGLGWCVGWVMQKSGRVAVFATRLKGKGASGARALEITARILRKLGYAKPKS